MKLQKLGVKPPLVGSNGGSSWITLERSSKSEFQFWYGNWPVAISTKVMPKDQTSERISYVPLESGGWIRSGLYE